jgi:hypothetical protein
MRFHLLPYWNQFANALANDVLTSVAVQFMDRTHNILYDALRIMFQW